MSDDRVSIDDARQWVMDRARKDGVDAEALIQVSRQFTTSFQQQKMDKYQFSKTQNLGLRIVSDGREGCAYTESFSVKDIEVAYNEAKENAKLFEKPYTCELIENHETKDMAGLFNADLEDISVDKKIELAKSLEAQTLSSHQQVVSAPYNAYGDFDVEISVCNTKGVNKSIRENGCYAYSYALAKEGDNSGMYSCDQISRDFNQLNTNKVGSDAGLGAVRKVNTTIPSSGIYKSALTNKAAKALLGFITGYFSAKAVDDGLSPLKAHLGKKVFSECITLIDDPFYKDGFGCQPFDSEGYPSQTTDVVRDGVLESWLFNSVYAKKMGTSNTGNASRSPSSELGISPTNLILQPGSANFEEICQRYSETMVIDAIKGFAGFNSISGDFSMEAEGYLVKNGEPQQQYANFVVSGNILSLLGQIEEVGNDLYVSSDSVLTPSLLVGDLDIAGQ
jgi:PmbA protein